MRPYRQRIVYTYLAKHGPRTTAELTHALGLPHFPGSNHPTKVAAQTLHKMRRAGIVERVPGGWHVVAGSKPPKDMRGKAKGSLVALASHSRENVVRLNVRLGRQIRPIATTALEQCWGWMPPSSLSQELQAKNEPVVIERGAVRPQETEAA